MKIYTYATSVVFSIVGILQLLRIVYEWPAKIGSVQIPLWASWVALIVTGSLAFYGWKLTRKR